MGGKKLEIFLTVFNCTSFLVGGSEESLIMAKRSAGMNLSPVFKTNPATYREEIGSSVTLLCKVKHLGQVQLLHLDLKVVLSVFNIFQVTL